LIINTRAKIEVIDETKQRRITNVMLGISPQKHH
jgi:hypothetical protein